MAQMKGEINVREDQMERLCSFISKIPELNLSLKPKPLPEKDVPLKHIIYTET